MSVGLVLVCHGGIGEVLLETARQVLGICPLPAAVVEVDFDADLEVVGQRVLAAHALVDQGQGVLLLTDMFGATPSNVAVRAQANTGAPLIAGVNLPMLIRVLNYPQLDLETLVEKALGGGRDGVLLVQAAPGAG